MLSLEELFGADHAFQNPLKKAGWLGGVDQESTFEKQMNFSGAR